jgi:membrane protein DedA with SNARE-associated domain
VRQSGCVSWAGLLAATGYLFGGAALGKGNVVAALSPLLGTTAVLIALLVLRGMEDRLQREADHVCREAETMAG